MPRVALSKQPPRAGTTDMLSARPSAVRARLGRPNDENISVDYIEACGDCFYLAMELALSEAEGWHPFYAVSTMREVVASHMTQETFDLYSLLHRQKAEGFAFMQGLESLEALADEVGSTRGELERLYSIFADMDADESSEVDLGELRAVAALREGDAGGGGRWEGEEEEERGRRRA